MISLLRTKMIIVIIFLAACPLFSSPRAVLFNGVYAYSDEQKLLVKTLAGIVNRDSARLYLLNVYETWSYNRTDEVWRDLYRSRGGVEFDSITSIAVLIDRFRPFIKGAVTFDASRRFGNFSGQSFLWQGEYAALIGGLTDRLPAVPATTSAYNLAIADTVLLTDSYDGDEPIWIPSRLEHASHPWNASTLTTDEVRYLSLLDYAVKYILPRCNPSKFYIREITDFTVQKKMFQVNLAGTDALDLNSMPAARADILERVLTYLHSKNPDSIFHIYGWMHPEPMVQWLAFFGASFHETLLSNVSFHSAFKIPERAYFPPAKVRPSDVSLQKKVYLTFMGSEGDASNWVFGFQGGAWLSADRGKIPFSWGWNLHLFEECPFVASYYFDTATSQDGFFSMTSPLGYAYPDLWESDVWNNAVKKTRELMDKFGVEVMYAYKHYAGSGSMIYRNKIISNSFNFVKLGQFQSAVLCPLTVLYDPDPSLPPQTPVSIFSNSTMFNHIYKGAGYGYNSFYGNVSNLDTAAQQIIANVKRQPKPGFLVAGYQRPRQDDFTYRSDPSSSDISIQRLLQLIQKIKSDPSAGADVEIVPIEVFSALMKRFTSVSQNKNIPADFSLCQNYPNPFNPRTMIQFSIPKKTEAALDIIDALGRTIETLQTGTLGAGIHTVEWNGSSFPSGVYFIRLKAMGDQLTRKMMLIR